MSGYRIVAALALTTLLFAQADARPPLQITEEEVSKNDAACMQDTDMPARLAACSWMIQNFSTDPHAVGLYYRRAYAQYQLQHYAEAVSDIDQTIARDPTMGEAFHMRGVLEVKLHQYQEALADFDHAVSLGHANSADAARQVREGLAEAMARAREAQEAKADNEATEGASPAGGASGSCAMTQEESERNFSNDFANLQATYPAPPTSSGARATLQHSYFLGTKALEKLLPYRQCMGTHYDDLKEKLEAMAASGKKGCEDLSSVSGPCPLENPR